jgi:putative transposase
VECRDRTYHTPRLRSVGFVTRTQGATPCNVSDVTRRGRIRLWSLQSHLLMQIEILALRHQLGVYQRTAARPRLRPAYRILWAWLSRAWSGWREALVIVKPETVIAWRRRRFREYWTTLTRAGKPGRPSIPREVRDLIRLHTSTVARYMVRHRRPPSATWRAFLKNHISDIVATDFFVVPTVRNQVLFVFLVLAHERRRVLHFNVTASPTAEWTGQQIIEAFPWDDTPRFLLRDRDRIYGASFRRRVGSLGVEEVLTAPRSPWQNPYVERPIAASSFRSTRSLAYIITTSASRPDSSAAHSSPLADPTEPCPCHAYGDLNHTAGFSRRCPGIDPLPLWSSKSASRPRPHGHQVGR